MCIEAKERGDDQIEVWGDGNATREFLFVEDAAEDIILATERYNDSEPFNLGSAFEISIKDLMKAVRETDVVVIVTDHKTYDFKAILDAAQFIFDTRNALGKLSKDNPKVERL